VVATVTQWPQRRPGLAAKNAEAGEHACLHAHPHIHPHAICTPTHTPIYPPLTRLPACLRGRLHVCVTMATAAVAMRQLGSNCDRDAVARQQWR